jgi:hypothetical protein
MLGSSLFLGGAEKTGVGFEVSGGIQSVLGRRSGEYRKANVKARITTAASPRTTRRSKMRLELSGRISHALSQISYVVEKDRKGREHECVGLKGTRGQTGHSLRCTLHQRLAEERYVPNTWLPVSQDSWTPTARHTETSKGARESAFPPLGDDA